MMTFSTLAKGSMLGTIRLSAAGSRSARTWSVSTELHMPESNALGNLSCLTNKKARFSFFQTAAAQQNRYVADRLSPLSRKTRRSMGCPSTKVACRESFGTKHATPVVTVTECCLWASGWNPRRQAVIPH
jgi:hypothetical protein